MATITINGVEYTSVDQVPPELRAVYERASQTGKTVSLTYKPKSIDELPPDIRQKVSEALGSAGRPQRTPTWLWAVVVATLAAVLTYLYQHAR
jgi:hypothetical protein